MLRNGRHGGVPGGNLRVVIVDELSTSWDALVSALRQPGREVLVERADQEDALVSLLRGFWPDVVFITAQARQLGVPAVLAAVRTVRPTVPVILLAGPGEEHRTATWIRTGIEEVVRRDAVGHAVEAVQRALEARQPALPAQPAADRGSAAHHRRPDQPGDRIRASAQREDGGDAPERRGPATRHPRRGGAGALRGAGRPHLRSAALRWTAPRGWGGTRRERPRVSRFPGA